MEYEEFFMEYKEFFMVVICLFIFFGILGILTILFYSENELTKQIKHLIKSLDKEDFNIINETKIGAVKVYPESPDKHGGGIEFVNRKLDLDGNVRIGIDVPSHSIHLANDDFCKSSEWNEAIGINSMLRISEQQYSEYLDLVKDCDIVSTTSFYLEIELSNSDVISRINKLNKYYGGRCTTKYMFERYNVLNLITDMQPFSDEEISDLIDKIKDRMIERL